MNPKCNYPGWHPLPAKLYALVEATPGTVLLETAPPAGPFTVTDACTRFFTAPLRICIASQAAELPTLFAEIESALAAGHCAAGFFTYECGSFFEPSAQLRPGRPGEPIAWFGIYERPCRFDHRSGEFLDGVPPGLAGLPLVDPAEDSAAQPLDAVFGLSEQQYAEKIAAIHEWIRCGDVYQLNFTAPIHLQSVLNPAALYRQLRRRQPVEYGAFLHAQPGRRILSFSPELFFRLDRNGSARTLTTRPMKGTAPRGRTNREDRELAHWLQNDAKNRSENVMIVDLLRNDLGRICQFGSVQARDLFAIERHPTLLQMTSTVSGELRPEIGLQQIFRALFPCGSITGAPKVRAMQLLAELEPEPRGVYTGAIGFFSPEQTVFNVAIRTLQFDGGRGTMGVGGGIVIDSDPVEEFRECLLKAEFLTRAPGSLPDRFALVETLLWEGHYPFLELHLDRLEDSSSYFGFPCDCAETKAALLAHAERMGEGQAPATIRRKVRLLLDRDGQLNISSELLPSATASSDPIRICIAPQRTDPQDRMLFHKTTHRPLYAQAYEAATRRGFADALFLNLRGEVTEGAIHNVFVEKNGRWLTPPVDCGLLAGVYRRHILETRPEVQEAVLTLDDLRQADTVYLCNAVRGLRRAIID